MDERWAFLNKHINSIVHVDNLEFMKKMPEGCIDLIFADPPYNMGVKEEIVLGENFRGRQERYRGVIDDWDKIGSDRDYEAFTKKWLVECRRVLKPYGNIFISGTKHCIYTIGYLGRRLGYYFVADIIWYKNNVMPDFFGRHLKFSHETILWLSNGDKQKHTFNYHTAKRLGNILYDGTRRLTQMGTVWILSTCQGYDRLKNPDGTSFHSTQKPYQLLENIVAIASKEGDLVMDPFSGTGTTCAAAKSLGRRWLGLEKCERYIGRSRARLEEIKYEPSLISQAYWDQNKEELRREAKQKREEEENRTLFTL